MKANTKKIVAFATQGSDGLDEARLKSLLSEFTVDYIPIQNASLSKKISSLRRVLLTCFAKKPDLVVMEGTGLLGGIPLILARWFRGVPYVISSGDAIGPFWAMKSPLLWPFGAVYERILCACSRGFIGWTPYLTGRALTLGSPHAMTAAGFQKFDKTKDEMLASRKRIRDELGITPTALVIGIAGSLAWNPRVGYAYGMELVRAMKQLRRPEVVALIVGDGNGLPFLEEEAGEKKNKTILFTGKVDAPAVIDYLAAMDVASLPQSVDRVGNFRYSTKLSEYLSVPLPMVVGQNPFTYDLDPGCFWRLPGTSPWSPEYTDALALLLETLTMEDVQKKKAMIPSEWSEFNRETQVSRVTSFIRDLLR